MKLSETITQAKRTVKIGTRRGSGFIYIGAPEEAIRSLDKVPRYKDTPRWEDREVLDTRYSDPVADETLIIIIEGRENGNHWFLGESKVPRNAQVKKQRHRQMEEPVSYKNHEGYDDPVAYMALNAVIAQWNSEAFA